MKRMLCAVVLVLLVCAGAWADVEINAENFPDDEFRNFLLLVDAELLNNDGKLDSDELKVPSINVEGAGIIESLQGIEYFTELRELYCGMNNIHELDLSGNEKLISLDCWSNDISVLEVSACSELRYLDCQQNHIRNLDVSGLSNLEYLECSNNVMDALDISGCDNLRELYCTGNSLSELDVSECRQLISLDCRQNHIMTSLNVNGCGELLTLA